MTTMTDDTLGVLRDAVQRAGTGDRLGAAMALHAAGEQLGADVTVDVAASASLGHAVVVVRERLVRDPLFDGLTTREREVADLLATGLRNKDIALALGISLGTVKDHVHHILEKTGLDGRAAVASRWTHR